MDSKMYRVRVWMMQLHPCFKRLIRKIRKASRESQYHMAGAQVMKTEATRMRRAPRKDEVSEKGPYDWNGGRRM